MVGGVEMFLEVSEIFWGGVGMFSVVLKLSLFREIERFLGGREGAADNFLEA